MNSSKWQETSLADLCDSIDYGYTASSETQPVGPKFLRITDIVKGYVNWEEVPYCKISPQDKVRFALNPGDVVIARTGATTGASTYISESPDAVFASYLVRLKITTKAEPQFIAYFLKSPAYWSYIHAVLGDKSAQPNASAKTLTQARLLLPPGAEQKEIARILGALDNKIGINRSVNATLEGTARAIFKSWFVDFDPVRAKAEGRQPFGMDAGTAVLFPSSFVDSPVGRIPKGWKSTGLDQVASFLNGLALQKFASDGSDSLPAIKIAQLRRGNVDGADRVSSKIPSEYVIRDGDVLFSWSGSLEVVVWCGGLGALNQHLFKVSSLRYPKWFFYYWILEHLPNFRHIAAGKATTMGHIQRHHLSEAKAVIPPESLISKADKIMNPLLQKRISNDLESRTLASIREAVLPKLISGEIRVKDVEQLVEARP